MNQKMISMLLSGLLCIGMLTACDDMSTQSVSSDSVSSEPISSMDTSSETSSEISSAEVSSAAPSSQVPASSKTEKKAPASSKAEAPTQSKAETPVSSASASSEAPKVEEAPNYSAGSTGIVEKEILRLINEERASLGLGQLSWNNKLYQSAKVRSDEMMNNAQRENIDHTRPDGSQWYVPIQNAGYKYSSVYENILFIDGAGQLSVEESARLAQMMFDSWKGSPSHYANIKQPDITETGIAVSSSGNEFYGTQHFGRPQ